MRLLGDRAVELHTAVEQVEGGAHVRLGLAVGRRRLEDDPRARLEVRLGLDELDDLHAAAALHERGVRAVGHLQQPPHRHLHTHGQEVVHAGVFKLGVLLRQADDGLVPALGILHGQQRPLAPHEDRRDHAREDDQVAQRQHHRLDQPIRPHLTVRDAVQFLGALGKRQVEIIFFFVVVPVVWVHESPAPDAVPGISQRRSRRWERYVFNFFHAAMTSAVTNIEPADNTMLPSFSDNSNARAKAASTGVTASLWIPAWSANP